MSESSSHTLFIPSASGSFAVTVPAVAPSVHGSTTSIMAIAESQIVLSTSKQIVYSTMYVSGVVFAGTLIVPSLLIETPTSPSSSLILILSEILPFVAATPSAKSVPLPLSSNTLAVVPPEAESIGKPLKSSFTASIVVGVKQKSISPIASPWNDGEQIPHSSHRIVMEDIPSASVILTFALPGGLPNPPFASKIASVVVKLTSKVSVGSF